MNENKDINKKEKTLSIVGAVSFVLIFAILMNLMSFVLKPKGGSSKSSSLSKYTSTDFSAEKPGSLDVVFIGNSNAYCAVSPMEIWHNYGIASYNCGEALLRINDVYYNFRKLLKNQKPKVAVLETDAFFSAYNGTQDMEKTLSGFFNNLFPTLEYHDSWKSLNKRNIPEKPTAETSTHASEKGYVFSNAVKGYNGDADYMKPTGEKVKVNAVQLLYFDKLYKLCEANGVKLVLVSAPSPACWTDAKHNAVNEVTQKYSLPFVDLNLTDIGMDFSTDTRDEGTHLNYSGAMKVTGFVGEYLKANYEFNDYRADPDYSQWNNEYENYCNDVNANTESSI